MKIDKLILKKIFRRISKLINKMGREKQCYICKQPMFHFIKYQNGYMSEFSKSIRAVGSDVNNYGCIYCKSNDRERHLFMFFDRLNFWGEIKKSKILHFAAERNLKQAILKCEPTEYILADLFPKDENTRKVDATNIPFPDNSFDIVICNHVLEHIIDYKKAINEIYRILRKEGIAILQTPYSDLLKNNFEDININTMELRLALYGQADHVRYFSKEQLLKDIQEAGFIKQIKENSDFFSDEESDYYGVNKKEELFMFIK